MDTTPLRLPTPEEAIRNRTESARVGAVFSAGGVLTTPPVSEEQARAFGAVLVERVRKLVEVWRSRERGRLPLCPQPISVEIMGLIGVLEAASQHDVGAVAASVEPVTPAGE